MQAFIPPFVGGQAKARDAGRGGDGGVDFFLEGEEGEQGAGAGRGAWREGSDQC